jgi:hypothetical protein
MSEQVRSLVNHSEILSKAPRSRDYAAESSKLTFSWLLPFVHNCLNALPLLTQYVYDPTG